MKDGTMVGILTILLILIAYASFQEREPQENTVRGKIVYADTAQARLGVPKTYIVVQDSKGQEFYLVKPGANDSTLHVGDLVDVKYSERLFGLTKDPVYLEIGSGKTINAVIWWREILEIYKLGEM